MYHERRRSGYSVFFCWFCGWAVCIPSWWWNEEYHMNMYDSGCPICKCVLAYRWYPFMKEV